MGGDIKSSAMGAHLQLGAPVSQTVVLLCLLSIDFGLCDYRSIRIRNADLCYRRKLSNPINNKVLEVGEGAVILQLKDPPLSLQSNIRNQREVCEIQIESPKRHGIMAHIEQMHMRRNGKDDKCLDFVQFGRNDFIPFVTVDKSARLCGEINAMSDPGGAFAYHEPGGSLLVWIHLGGRSATPYWPHIGVVNLTLVVTSHRKSCDRNTSFRRCDAAGRACIRKEYFCDRHLNCPTVNGSLISPDERGCDFDDKAVVVTTPKDSEGAVLTFGDLNIISWTIILVCTCFLCLILFIVIVVRARKARVRNRRKCGDCCCLGFANDAGSGSSREFPESYQLGIVELSSRRRRHGEEAEQNLYAPLSVIDSRERGHGRVGESLQLRQVTGSAAAHGGGGIPEEAPPAYNDLFPDGVPQHVMAVVEAESSVDAAGDAGSLSAPDARQADDEENRPRVYSTSGTSFENRAATATGTSQELNPEEPAQPDVSQRIGSPA